MSKQQANTTHRRLQTALAAMQGLEPWLAFRYLLAQGYNQHAPQGPCQKADKARAARLAADLVQGMGGDLHQPTPGGVAAGPAWQAFRAAVTGAPPECAISLMWALWDGHQWADPQASHLQMQALTMTLADMRKQQGFNDAGWSAETGWPKNRTGRRS